MHNPAYLALSRHSVYYFRWPIPKALHSAGRRCHVKLSLGTRKPDEALHLARVLEYHASSIIRRYGPALMKNNEAKAIVQEYCQKILEERKRQIVEEGPLSDEKIAFYHTSLEDAETRKELVRDGIEIDDSQPLAALIKTMGVDITQGSDAYRALRQQYALALPAFSEELLRFNKEQTGFDFAPAVSASRSPAAASTHILHPIATKFVEMYVQDKRWDTNTEQEKRAHIATLEEIIGEGFNLKDMDAEKARYVRDIIKRLPKNRNKNPKTRGLNIKQVLEIKGITPIAPATVKKYIETYNAFFAWCVDEGYIEKNYFQSLRNRGEGKGKSKSNRLPYTEDQIKIIREEVDKRDAGLANKEYRYWGTLIGMYTGARLNEISQIMLTDIKQEGGIWFFDMNDDGDSKKLKTSAARRKVPIHSALLDRGIIEYRNKLEKQGKERLLYELTFCKKNGYGKKLGTWFNTVLLPKLNMKTPRIVFHCFRHTANTRLRQEGVPLTVVQTIIGHARSGGASEIYFAEGYTLPVLKEAIEHLHPL